MQKPIKIQIDTTNQDAEIIYNNIVKGDTLLATFSIFQGGQSLNLAGQKMHIIIKKADGYTYEKIVESVTGNNFTTSFDVQATLAVGDNSGEIQILDNNGVNISNKFVYEVLPTNADDIVTKSSDKIETLQQIIGLINTYNANADNLAIQNQLALQHEATLAGLNSTAGTLANRLETDIVNGNNTAERLENDIMVGNQLDSNLKQDIAVGTPLHNILLADIANGNYTAEQLKNANWTYIQSMFNLFEKTTLENQSLTTENDITLTDENDVALLF